MSLNDVRFARLMDEVDRQGGAHLPGVCRPVRIDYRKHRQHYVQKDGTPFVVEFADVNDPPISTTGCNRESRFVIPDLDFAHEPSGDTKTTTVCFYDDGLMYWPRFAAIHEEDDS